MLLKHYSVAFHALFFTDVYLAMNMDALLPEGFHHEHAETFGNYEELQERVLINCYSNVFIVSYLGQCRRNLVEVLDGETVKSICVPVGFPR
jgi:hypothetical protein